MESHDRTGMRGAETRVIGLDGARVPECLKGQVSALEVEWHGEPSRHPAVEW